MDVDSQHPYCVMCVIARLAGLHDWHADCTGRDGTRWCVCNCDWLEADMAEHFPSLRGKR